MNIEVHYYEMDTDGNYSYMYDTLPYTGLTESTFYVPDYSKSGFHLDRSRHSSGNPSIVVSGNESANIIDVSVTCGPVATIKQQMDMSGPNNTASQTPSVTSLGYFCEFKNPANNTELTVTIAADEQISVKTTRFTIFELL
jgi:hypothetical protein